MLAQQKAENEELQKQCLEEKQGREYVEEQLEEGTSIFERMEARMEEMEEEKAELLARLEAAGQASAGGGTEETFNMMVCMCVYVCYLRVVAWSCWIASPSSPPVPIFTFFPSHFRQETLAAEKAAVSEQLAQAKAEVQEMEKLYLAEKTERERLVSGMEEVKKAMAAKAESDKEKKKLEKEKAKQKKQVSKRHIT